MSDFSHINVTELEAVIKKINISLKWNLNDIEVKMDSFTVAKYINSTITGDPQVKT